MGCICSSCHSLWLRITNRYHKIEEVDSTELLDSTSTCAYPFCYTINSIAIDHNRKYFKFRNHIYCSRKCLESHKKINYSVIDYSTAEYADL